MLSKTNIAPAFTKNVQRREQKSNEATQRERLGSENRVGEGAKSGVHCGQCKQQVPLPHKGENVACSGNEQDGNADGRPN